jgi:hypothetical protein
MACYFTAFEVSASFHFRSGLTGTQTRVKDGADPWRRCKLLPLPGDRGRVCLCFGNGSKGTAEEDAECKPGTYLNAVSGL